MSCGSDMVTPQLLLSFFNTVMFQYGGIPIEELPFQGRKFKLFWLTHDLLCATRSWPSVESGKKAPRKFSNMHISSGILIEWFIKFPEEGRLICPKYRETSSCCFVINVYIFVLDKTAGFGYRHFIYKAPYKPYRNSQHQFPDVYTPPDSSQFPDNSHRPTKWVQSLRHVCRISWLREIRAVYKQPALKKQKQRTKVKSPASRTSVIAIIRTLMIQHLCPNFGKSRFQVAVKYRIPITCLESRTVFCLNPGSG